MPGNQGLLHELLDLNNNEGGDDSDYDPENEVMKKMKKLTKCK